jgi:hypothetical protein
VLGVEERGVEDEVEAEFEVVLSRGSGTTVGLRATLQVLTMKVEITGKWLARR